MMSKSNPHQVAVIGAGIIGMSCALRLQTELLNVQVTVISEKFSPDLLSDGAAGLWDPYDLLGTDPARGVQWGVHTYHHLLALGLSADSIRSGVSPISYYMPFVDTDPLLPKFSEHVFHFNRMSPADIAKIPGCKAGFKFTTVICEPTHYLPWIMEKFLKAGGKVIQRKVSFEGLKRICDEYDLVVNCPGLAAREMMGDTNMFPIRGQVTKVKPKAPINWTFSFRPPKGNRHYVIPGRDVVTLGGTYDIGDSSTDIKEDVKQRILTDSCLVEPVLQEAKVLYDWCGSRPARRGGTRLEVDPSLHPHTKVIHNYGHGGIGISLHWGCATEVLDLTRRELHNVSYRQRMKSKL